MLVFNHFIGSILNQQKLCYIILFTNTSPQYTHTIIIKCHLRGAPAERLSQHKAAQYFYGSTHCRHVQHGSCNQQGHVHPVSPSRSLHRSLTGVLSEVAAVLWLFVGSLFHLKLRWTYTFNICTILLCYIH